MKTLVLLFMCAVSLAGCGSLGDFQPRVPVESQAQLVIELQMGTLVYDLNMRHENLIYPFINKVDEGYYNGLFIDRMVPELFAQTGDGYWMRRDGWSINAPQKPGRRARGGELALSQNEDGSYGPNLMMLKTVRTTGLTAEVPPTLVMGWLLEGRDVLNNLRKGDRILRMYGRKFDTEKEPFRNVSEPLTVEPNTAHTSP